MTYDLKESFEKIGVLPIPRFVDKEGHDIDGFHRRRLGVDVPVFVIPVKNPGQRHIMRLVINGCRRQMSREEITQTLVAIAEFYGWKAKDMVGHLPFSPRWIYDHLPDEYKDRPGAGGPRPSAPPVAERATREETLELPPESDAEFIERFFSTFKAHLTQITKKDFPVIVDHMSEDQNCEECPMKAACEMLLTGFLQLQKQLPNCMRAKLDY